MARLLRVRTLLLAATLAVAVSGPVFASGPAATDRSLTETLLDGHRVINVVDDFLVFWEKAKGGSPERQRRLWLRLVENKHRDYFERAVYRGAGLRERQVILDQFLAEVPDRIDAIREFNRRLSDPATSPLIAAIVDFRTRFVEYRHQGPAYVGLSLLRFDGAVRAVHNDRGIPDTLCLGADVLASYSPQQIRIAIAHELFHLYQFGFLFRHPDLYDYRTGHIPLMVEGMAVAAVEEIYPFQPAEVYLHFSAEELAFQRPQMAENAAQFLEALQVGAPAELFERWFVAGPESEVPARGGYLLGYVVARRLLTAFTLEGLARMDVYELREHAEEQLAGMALEGSILLATLH